MRQNLVINLDFSCDADNLHCRFQNEEGKWENCKFHIDDMRQCRCVLFGKLWDENGGYSGRILRHPDCIEAAKISFADKISTVGFSSKSFPTRGAK